MSNIKIVKDYLYEGLGFPILLKEAEMRNVRGEWLLKIDVEKVADILIKALPKKTAGLTGAEIKFIRTYFNLSQRKFADELNVSHTAVRNWEDTDQERAKVDSHVEINLRALVKLKLHQENDFTDFYKSMLVGSKHFNDATISKPISIEMRCN